VAVRTINNLIDVCLWSSSLAINFAVALMIARVGLATSRQIFILVAFIILGSSFSTGGCSMTCAQAMSQATAGGRDLPLHLITEVSY
jgi:hypothetical protein